MSKKNNYNYTRMLDYVMLSIWSRTCLESNVLCVLCIIKIGLFVKLLQTNLRFSTYEIKRGDKNTDLKIFTPHLELTSIYILYTNNNIV